MQDVANHVLLRKEFKKTRKDGNAWNFDFATFFNFLSLMYPRKIDINQNVNKQAFQNYLIQR